MKIYVNKDKVEFEDKQVILSGAINSYTADVYFDESWDGLTKEAIIVKNKEDVGTEHYITTNTVTFDIEKTGFYQIGFKGYTVNENNEKVYQAVTNLEMFPVLKGSGEIDGIKPELPKATEWEIYLQQIEEMVTGLSKLPKGGNTNQALVKNSDLDYDMSWQYVEGGSAGGGTSDYEKLENLPSINRIKLIGNKTTEDLGILKDVKNYVENYVDENKEELKGDTGKSAYEIWLEEGNRGTEQDFINSLEGKDGFSPSAKVQETATGAIINITDKNGTTSAEIKNGKDGTNGDNGITPTIGNNGNWYLGDTDTGKPSKGADGYTPVKGVDYFDGKTPIKGTDYFTEADKEELVQDVLDALPSSEEVEY